MAQEHIKKRYCLDCNKKIVGKEYEIGSIDRKVRCKECSDDYEEGVYVMGDW